VALALPPLPSTGAVGEIEQVIPEAAAQTRLTAPAKPLAEARLIVSVALLPAVTDKVEACGVSVKSERGFEIFTTVEEGALVLLPP
jgi:hypothetical protein